MNNRFMQKALDKGWEGQRNGQEPFGACVVKNGEIISVSHNTIRKDLDVTAHAEINAIREACINLQTTDLTGCDIYATFKPCNMCLEACKRANINQIYYGAGPEDISTQRTETIINIKGGIMKEQCLELALNKYPK
jgi:tRNA(Arg) A34 adenosine deaminase TadA